MDLMYGNLDAGEAAGYAKPKRDVNRRLKVLESYSLDLNDFKPVVEILERKRIPHYHLVLPQVGVATKALVHEIKDRLVDSADMFETSPRDAAELSGLKKELAQHAGLLLENELPDMKEDLKRYLTQNLVNETMGLGDIEFLLSDNDIEEIVINSAREPVRIYHKKYGWMKTNIRVESESELLNQAHTIARHVGKDISNLNPRLDAYLHSGDRVNATLSPISIKGHTLTIRKFSRDPWTVTDFIRNKTASSSVMALLWLALEYEMNAIISGGTGSGKTSFLNTCMPFIQPSHRIISIEDTKELQLPEFLYWCPMLTREANQEGKGEVSMLDLLVNSLRMRPDRIIMGEIRKQREAEVLFEAMHTGHSVYGTLHADTCAQTISRLTNPPVNIPHSMLDAVHLNIVMFRDRRRKIRRVFEVGEFIPSNGNRDDARYVPRILYRWDARNDVIQETEQGTGIYEKITLRSGLSTTEIEEDLKTRKGILDWMSANNLRNIDDVGRLMNVYYTDPEIIRGSIERGLTPGKMLEEEACLQEGQDLPRLQDV
ncbi:MAG: type II/IV secretion system ATPase subunit [Candidatus Altiarchaeota archaeon]|nr:type II/IV secretion system ATPase subunit [Candidatus Altiarchaeota archaeon]